MKKDVAFVVVTYHPNRQQLRYLQSTFSDYLVIAVDNSVNNRGYGGGGNVGIRKALKAGAEWVVVVNQDLKVTKNAIEKFVGKLEKASPGIAGPFAGGLDPHRWTTVLNSTPGVRHQAPGSTPGVGYISGACFAIHRDVIEKVGFIYEPYFLYYEEVDLCMRAKKAGFPLTHIPVQGITHEESVSLGRGSLLHQYYLARNHLLFLERCAPGYVRSYEYLRLPKTILEHVRRGERGALLGIRDYFFRRFGQYNKGQ